MNSILQYLQEITAVNVRSDFDPGFLQFLIPVCFAQAQECIAEKSISGNRKLNISGKKREIIYCASLKIKYVNV